MSFPFLRNKSQSILTSLCPAVLHNVRVPSKFMPIFQIYQIFLVSGIVQYASKKSIGLFNYTILLINQQKIKPFLLLELARHVAESFWH
jgi:hypothetical protein